MSTTVSYKGNTIATVENNTKTLKTAGKYLEGDVILTDVTSSGGGSTVKIGALRPDAELVQTWTYDKMYVEDEAGTIPAYSTSDNVLLSFGNLTPTVSVNFADYDYVTTIRVLIIPSYSNQTISKARQVCFYTVGTSELLKYPQTQYVSGVTTSMSTVICTYEQPRIVYWSSTTSVASATSSTKYGVYANITGVTLSPFGSDSATLTPRSPSFYIRGSSTYLDSTNWALLDDIRLQYVIELWRSPKGTVNGFASKSQIDHVIDCFTTDGKLT